MPRYYCDYCDSFLTHDSLVVRKQHNTGLKHKANFRAYYKEFFKALEDPLQGNARAKEELQRQIVTNYNAFMANGPPPGYFGGPPGFGRRDGPPRGGFGGRGPPMGFRGGPPPHFGGPPPFGGPPHMGPPGPFRDHRPPMGGMGPNGRDHPYGGPPPGYGGAGRGGPPMGPPGGYGYPGPPMPGPPGAGGAPHGPGEGAYPGPP